MTHWCLECVFKICQGIGADLIGHECSCDALDGRAWLQQDYLQNILGGSEPATLPHLRARHLVS